jgi:hypothetical protein
MNTETCLPWPESASELYSPSDSSLSAKLVPTSADIRPHVVSMTDPNGRILGFLDRSLYIFFQVAPHKTEWTQFQTQYFSEYLVVPRIEPGTTETCHGRTVFSHITG